MKVAIADTSHFEVLDVLITLFGNEGHDITVYANDRVKRQVTGAIAEMRVRWVLQGSKESNRRFLSRMFEDLRSTRPDLFFISTAAHNHSLFALRLALIKKLPVILTLHDINSYLNFPVPSGLRSLFRTIGKRMLFKRADAYHVLAQTLADYLRVRTTTAKPVFMIPGGIYDDANSGKTDPAAGSDNIIFAADGVHKHAASDQNIFPDKLAVPNNPSKGSGSDLIERPRDATSIFDQPIRIVVPGSVDLRRRRYLDVFKLLQHAANEGVDVEVILLGAFAKNDGDRIRSMCIDYSAVNTNLTWFDVSVIDQPVFDKILRSAHFIWTPLQEQLQPDHDATEIYGQSVCSGNIGDIIRSARPFLAPSSIALDADLLGACIRYSDTASIVKFLKQLDSNSYQLLEAAALHTSGLYTAKKIRDRYRSLFIDLSL